MVDALWETWRVLSPNGILMDLRPLPSSKCLIEIVSSEEAVPVGEVDASGVGTDDVAADHAVRQAVMEGWFLQHQDACFEFRFYWETVSEMASFMEGSSRMRNVRPSYTDLEKVHREWSAAGGCRARLRCARPMLLAGYQKAVKVFPCAEAPDRHHGMNTVVGVLKDAACRPSGRVAQAAEPGFQSRGRAAFPCAGGRLSTTAW